MHSSLWSRQKPVLHVTPVSSARCHRWHQHRLGGTPPPQNVQLLSTTNTSEPASTSSQAKDHTGLKHPTVAMGWCKSRARCQEVFSHLRDLIPAGVNHVREEKQAPAKHQSDCAHWFLLGSPSHFLPRPHQTGCLHLPYTFPEFVRAQFVFKWSVSAMNPSESPLGAGLLLPLSSPTSPGRMSSGEEELCRGRRGRV